MNFSDGATVMNIAPAKREWETIVDKYNNINYDNDLLQLTKYQENNYLHREQNTSLMLLKNLMDYSFAVFWLLLLSPLFLLVMMILKIFGKGPIFYSQIRVGKDFKFFKIYKFRTMFVDSPSNVISIKEPLKKLIPDPRVTKIGKYLRRWRIDEAPQLLCVLQGKMSFIGPRPLTVEDTKYCSDQHMNRFAIKPGMFGLWQALRPNTIPYKLKFYCDSKYVKVMNLRLDIYLFILCLKRGLSPEDS